MRAHPVWKNFKLKQAIELTETSVYFFFGNTNSARGDFYQRSKRVTVPHLDVKRRLITGAVQGTEPQPYHVQIFFNKTPPIIAKTTCSCPMGGMCRHAAALLLHAIRIGLVGSSPPLPTEASHSVSLGRPLDRLQLTHNLPSWVTSLTEALGKNEGVTQNSSNIDSVFYLIDVSQVPSRLHLRAVHARKLQAGGFGHTQAVEIERLAAKSTAYVTAEDSKICQLFLADKRDSSRIAHSAFPEIPEISGVIIEKLLATGRCYWKHLSNNPLKLSTTKKAMLRWETLGDGKQVLKIDTGDDGDIVIVAGGAWYVNTTEAKLGPLEPPVPIEAVRSILAAPPVEPHEAAAVAEVFKDFPALIPKLCTEFTTEIVIEKLQPRLRLTTQEETNYWHSDHHHGTKQPMALVKFEDRKSVV